MNFIAIVMAFTSSIVVVVIFAVMMMTSFYWNFEILLDESSLETRSLCNGNQTTITFNT